MLEESWKGRIRSLVVKDVGSDDVLLAENLEGLRVI
jgi:hypothetical protein